MTGFYGAPSVLGGFRIKRSDYLPCRVPNWRVTIEEPADMKINPAVSEGGDWAKLVPVDPNCPRSIGAVNSRHTVQVDQWLGA